MNREIISTEILIYSCSKKSCNLNNPDSIWNKSLSTKYLTLLIFFWILQTEKQLNYPFSNEQLVAVARFEHKHRDHEPELSVRCYLDLVFPSFISIYIWICNSLTNSDMSPTNYSGGYIYFSTISLNLARERQSSI